MSWQKFSEFLVKLKLAPLLPIIIVYGSDRFLRKKLVAEVVQKLGQGKKVEREIFYGPETSPEEILTACQTYSMFAPFKIVLVYQIQAFNQNQRAQLLSYLENPNPTTELILFADPPEDYSEEKKFRNWFVGAAKQTEVVDVSSLTSQEIEALIKQLVKDWGKRISEEAIALLLETIGPEPEKIYLELEKICLFLGEAKLITPELVSELVIGSRLQNIFELAESLGKRDREQSFRIYRKMLEQKQPREMLLSIIKRHYRVLLELQASLGSEQMEKEVLERFRIPRSFYRQYQLQAERFSEADLKKVFQELYDSECELKSSPLSEDAIMEKLILRLCQI